MNKFERGIGKVSILYVRISLIGNGKMFVWILDLSKSKIFYINKQKYIQIN